MDRGLSSITRRDQQRLVTVTSEVDAEITTPLALTEQIQNEYTDFSQRYPGYELIWMGEKREASESMRDMSKALMIALVVIFVILTALFKSLLDPLVIMFAIPFGLIGVVFGHWLMDLNIQFLSVIGFLALSGIVVNDSLILLDFAKRNMAQGEDRMKAMLNAGRVRARPIILTSVTTFLGISPLIFFASGQTAFLSPMAVSLGFGLLFATVLILFSLPCVYLIVDDMRLRLSRHK
jgi:multidrug efflux pump subunit AcrB